MTVKQKKPEERIRDKIRLKDYSIQREQIKDLRGFKNPAGLET